MTCPFESFRQRMPVARSLAYFDHAAVGPLTQPAHAAIAEWNAEATYLGDSLWPKWNRRVQQLRETAAGVLNASPEEIAIVANTTTGINLVAAGLNWDVGDNVVLPAGEFPSNLFPWMMLERKGVEIRQVPLGDAGAVDLNRIDEACDARTRVVTASWIGFASGYRLDPRELAEVAHRHGAYCFLDAIQGMGVFPLDVAASGIDFLAADGHKWMLGPEGAGLFFVRQALLDELQPQLVGWNSVQDAFNYSSPDMKLKATAARFEGGSQNMVGITGLLASLQLLVDTGLSPHSETLAKRVLETSELLCQRLSECGATVHSDRSAEHASGIVSFDPPMGKPEAVRAALVRQGIVLSCRGGRLRCAVHAYNDASDVERIDLALRCIRESI